MGKQIVDWIMKCVALVIAAACVFTYSQKVKREWVGLDERREERRTWDVTYTTLSQTAPFTRFSIRRVPVRAEAS